jgi:putative DNA primase/helicase
VTAPVGGQPPLPPGINDVENPKQPHLNVIQFLDAKYSDPTSGKWTLIWYHEAFYVWVGTHWRILHEDTLYTEVYEYFEDSMYWALVGGAVNGVWQWVDFNIDPAKMNALMQGIKAKTLVDAGVDMPAWLGSAANIALTEEEWRERPGADPHEMIACQNGLLYTRTRSLWGQTPRFLNDFAVEYNYEPNVDAPQEWLNFLKSLWPEDPESINTLQEMYGYLLTQRNDHQKMFFLYGAKRGGKGTIIRVLEALMGQTT